MIAAEARAQHIPPDLVGVVLQGALSDAVHHYGFNPNGWERRYRRAVEYWLAAYHTPTPST
jgi:hypothetical protein